MSKAEYMPNIVFLVRHYHPSFTAVGYCTYCVAKCLTEDHGVTVVGLRCSSDEPTFDQIEGQTLVRISHRRHDWRLWLSKTLDKTPGLAGFPYRILFNCLRVLEWFLIAFSLKSVDRALVLKYQEAIQSIDTQFRERGEMIDALVPTCAPIEAVIAAMEFKRRHDATHLIPYFFDPFSDSPTLHRLRISRLWKDKQHYRIERDLGRLSSLVLCMNHLKETRLITSIESKQRHKIAFAEHPLLARSQTLKSPSTEGQLRLIYAGSFNRTVRDPTSLLMLLAATLTDLDGVADIYSAGNCSYLVRGYANASSGRIVDHGYIQKAEVDNAIRRSDILLSVGNTASNLVPSKIFEYISLGKPIVHCYTDVGDSVVGTLASYPLSLCLKMTDSLAEDTVNRFISFCAESRHDRLAFEDVALLYGDARPEFTGDIIRCLVGKEHPYAFSSCYELL